MHGMHTDNQKTLEMLAALLSGVIARTRRITANAGEVGHGNEGE